MAGNRGLLPGYGIGARPEPIKTYIPPPDEARPGASRQVRLTGERRQVELLFFQSIVNPAIQIDTNWINTESYDSIVVMVFLTNLTTISLSLPGSISEWENDSTPSAAGMITMTELTANATAWFRLAYGPDAPNGSTPTAPPAKWMRWTTSAAAASGMIIYGVRRPANTQRPAAEGW